jgi:hypothetical protein
MASYAWLLRQQQQGQPQPPPALSAPALPYSARIAAGMGLSIGDLGASAQQPNSSLGMSEPSPRFDNISPIPAAAPVRPVARAVAAAAAATAAAAAGVTAAASQTYAGSLAPARRPSEAPAAAAAAVLPAAAPAAVPAGAAGTEPKKGPFMVSELDSLASRIAPLIAGITAYKRVRLLALTGLSVLGADQRVSFGRQR